MNKLISRIAVLGASIGMAVAVGVAVSSKKVEQGKAADYTKITTLAGITPGSYVIGATISDSDYFFKVDSETVADSVDGKSVSSIDSATTVTLAGSGSTWTIQLSSGNYLSLKNSKANGKVVIQAESANWTVTEKTNLLNFAIGEYALQRNNDASLDKFGSYKNTQTDVWLASVSTKTLVSVTLEKNDSQVKKSYFEGEAASTAGLTVKANYDSGDPVDVTSQATITANPANVALSTTSISYTASFGNKTSEPVVVDGITVTEHDYSGTFVLASNTTTYTPITTDEVFHQKITNADSFTASDFDQGFRVGGTPNTSDIMLGSNKDHGGTVKLTVPAGYVISTVVLNGKSDSSGDSELTIGGYTKTVTNSDYADYSFYNLGNSVTLTSSIRIWAKTITIAVAKVTTGSVANAYAAAFIAMTSADCTAKNVSEATWAAVKAVFQNIERDFASEAALIKAADESVEAIARYKFIVEKYGYEDFLNKGYEVGKYLELGVAAPQGVAGYVIVISIGTASILAIGLVLMLKKKKHTK